jgi:hypothetical protein
VATILFVHGTGVRKDGYDATYAVIQKKIESSGHTLAPCLWGDEYGAKYPKLSLPSPNPDDSGEFPLWSILANDPLYELELLAPPQLSPAGSQIGNELWGRIDQYQQSPALQKLLGNCGLAQYWDDAWNATIHKSDLAERTLTEAIHDIGTTLGIQPSTRAILPNGP